MTMAGRRRRWTLTVVVALAVALAGCAAMQTAQTQSTEQLLSASGFHMKLADNPAKQAKLATLMPNKIVPHDHNGKVLYVYADPANNRLFVGDQQAYQNFQTLAVAKQIAEDQRQAAAMNADAAMDWDMWGPDPWW
jgi:cell division protein YceG involved in septum cleavage